MRNSRQGRSNRVPMIRITPLDWVLNQVTPVVVDSPLVAGMQNSTRTRRCLTLTKPGTVEHMRGWELGEGSMLMAGNRGEAIRLRLRRGQVGEDLWLIF